MKHNKFKPNPDAKLMEQVKEVLRIIIMHTGLNNAIATVPSRAS